MQLYVVIDDYDGVVNIFNSEEEMYYEVDPADYPDEYIHEITDIKGLDTFKPKNQYSSSQRTSSIR